MPVESSWNSPGVSCALCGPALAGAAYAQAATATTSAATWTRRLTFRFGTAFPPSMFGTRLSSSFRRIDRADPATTRSARRAAQHPLVADAPRDAVRVHPLEQELCRPARDSELVAEACEADRAVLLELRNGLTPSLGIGGGRHRGAVTEPDELACPPQERGQLAILDPKAGRAGGRELGCERLGLGRPLAERG